MFAETPDHLNLVGREAFPDRQRLAVLATKFIKRPEWWLGVVCLLLPWPSRSGTLQSLGLPEVGREVTQFVRIVFDVVELLLTPRLDEGVSLCLGELALVRSRIISR